MGARLLRQHYEGVSATVATGLCGIVDPWLRHRRRFIASLKSLTAEQWNATTRCTEWDAKDVVAHLITADGFWTLSLDAARTGRPPTTYLRGFDPSSSLDPLVESMRATPTADLLDQFATGTDTFIAAVDQFCGADWDALAESPFGHLASRFIFTHAFWDSWLHERDIFVPLGVAPPVEPDELLTATWFTFFVAGVQGGLREDPAPVGAGLEQPIDITLRFDDLPVPALRVQIDTGVGIGVGEAARAVAAGSALDLVERFSGRLPPVFDTLPEPALVVQLERAAQIL
jgi:uncharacterized protein (TIGR03083 family)